MVKFKLPTGPGIFITAAFIGPGTVTVCVISGTQFGFALIWVIALAIAATIVFQSMAAKLGVVTGKGLGEVLREKIKHPVVRVIILGLTLMAIVLGNAAYEAGNISGAALGIDGLFIRASTSGNGVAMRFTPIIIGLFAAFLLWRGSYRILKMAMLTAVGVMSLSFLLAAIYSKPSIGDLLSGVIPTLPDGALFTAMALLGTTIVPYNLFLHAALSKDIGNSPKSVSLSSRDTRIAVFFGGLISLSIVVASASVQVQSVGSAADLAAGLVPVFGVGAKYLVGLGLLAAGLSSAITAPLAAAFVAGEIFGWSSNMKSPYFRFVSLSILTIGVSFSSFGWQPIQIIHFAQFANGLLLPVIAVLLIWVMNDSRMMGKYVNTDFQNIAGLLVIIVSLILGAKSIISALGL